LHASPPRLVQMRGERDPEIIELRTTQNALAQRLEQELAKLKTSFDESLGRESQRLAELIADGDRQASQALEERFEERCQTSTRELGERQATALRDAVEPLSERFDTLAVELEKLGGDIGDMKATTSGVQMAPAAAVEASRVEAREQVGWELADFSQALEERLEESRQISKRELGESQATALREAIEPLRARVDALAVELEKLGNHIGDTKGTTSSAQMEPAAAIEASEKALTEELRVEMKLEVDSVKRHAESVLRDMTEMMADHKKRLSHAELVVENMYTRSVTWRVNGFREKLYQLLQQDDRRFLRSPGFSVCGRPELVMELLVGGETMPSVHPLAPPVPVPGSCSIRIWAPVGLDLTFRLTLGDGPSAVSKRLEHVFQFGGELEDSEARTSFQVHNICQLDQIWRRDLNAIDITFEILDMKTISPLISVPLARERTANSRPRSPECPAGMEPVENGDVALAEDSHDPRKVACDDELAKHSSVTSEGALRELVKGDMQAMRNRSVRRVEWKLEGCWKLLDTCRAGEAIESPVFCAGGLDRLQFHFYPRGCETGLGASSNAQFCALYVSGPAKTTVRGQLSVGSISRHFEQRYQCRGDLGGRPRFCNLETMLDCNDAVVIAVQLIEVETDLLDSNHSLCLREARTLLAAGSPGAGGTGLGTASSGGGVCHGAKGSLRMRREDPSKTEEVVRCISLPTLNTRQHYLPHVSRGQRSR